MLEMITALFVFFFEQIENIPINFISTDSESYSSIMAFMENIALLVKPIGYSLLAVFSLLEFAKLSEKAGSVNGFMGTGLVINVLIKIILCKLVVDNSTEICEFIIGVGDQLTTLVGAYDIESVDYQQFLTNIENAFPDWWDVFGQVAFFLVSAIFMLISLIAIIAVKIIFTARYIELYVLTAISPIPLSTCLSKEFNMATNFIKNVFAVALQGTLLLLVIRVFNIIFVYQVNSIGEIAKGDWGAIWGMLGVILFNALLLLVCAFQTQRWAKSICHAM